MKELATQIKAEEFECTLKVGAAAFMTLEGINEILGSSNREPLKFCSASEAITKASKKRRKRIIPSKLICILLQYG